MAQTKMQIEDWLDDLCVRFIINLPREELESVERICFQVEEAQWFYEDFIRPLDPTLPSMSLRSFCLRIFQHCPLLSEFSHDHHVAAFSEFLAYKIRVPVRGAILLNHAMDQVVLVKGWKKGANWSFPRGKINKDERDLDCAVREVYEETGYDIKEAGLLKDDSVVSFIEVTMREQNIRLYVFKDVPMDTQFRPRTRKEISNIQWHRLADLPTLRKSRHQSQSGVEGELLGNANKFYMVAPFLAPLKKWIAGQRRSSLPKAEAPKDIAAELGTETIVNAQDPGGNSETQAVATAVAVPRDISDVRSVQPSIENAVEDASTQLKRLLSVQTSQTPAHTAHSTSWQNPQSNQEGANVLLAMLRNGARHSKQQHRQGIQPIEPLIAASQATPPASEEPHTKVPLPVPFANIPSHAVPNRPEISLYQNQQGTQFPPQQTPSVPVRREASMASFQEPHELPAANRLEISQLLPQSRKTSTPSQVHQSRPPHHAVVPSASQLPPPKLTTHSLNLLHFFKNGQVSQMNAQSITGEASDSYKTRNTQNTLDGTGSTKINGLPLHQNNLNPTLALPGQPTSTQTPPSQLLFDRGRGQSADQKKALLSLFSKSSSETTSTAPPTVNTPTRLDEKLSAVRADILSQVSSRQGTSDSNARHDVINPAIPTATRTPKSSADREFLLGYLKGMAKG